MGKLKVGFYTSVLQIFQHLSKVSVVGLGSQGSDIRSQLSAAK